MDNLTIGANLSFIRRDRGSRGGGVAIAFNPTRIRLSKLPFERDKKKEIVCAVGNCSLSKRKVALIAAYLPPSINAAELDGYIYSLVDMVDNIILKHPDAMIYVGGDFNKKDLSRFRTAFPSLLPIQAGATRRNEALDEIYTNMVPALTRKAILPPLCKEDGTVSDHSIIASAFKLPKQNRVYNKYFTIRPITKDGKEQFGKLMATFNWENVAKPTSSESALALNFVLCSFINKCFPVKQRKIKSNDAPWFDGACRRAVKRKKRIYRREGKSERYKEASRDCKVVILRAKKKFWGRVLDKTAKLGNSKYYYRSVKLFSTKENPVEWDICNLFPDYSDQEITEAVAVFFNRISQEYPPLPNPGQAEILADMADIIMPHEVSARLKSFRKPKSQVEGDIPPDLVTQFHDLLAIPLSRIFNLSLIHI